VNDAHASVARKDYDSDTAFFDAVRAKVEKRIGQIESGDVPGSRAPADPLAAKRRELFKKAHEAGMSDDEAFAVLEKAIAKRLAA
jgi:hypothetical protein